MYDGSRLVKTWDSVSHYGRALGLKKPDNIYTAIKNNTKAYGYYWRYKSDTLQNEIFKTHHCGKFVSNKGRFKVRNGVSFGSIRRSGYLTCSHKNKTYLVHRLVAETFLPKPDGTDIVDHIDGNRSNNDVDNLRWVTYKENAYDRKPRGPIMHCSTCTCNKHTSLYP